MQSRGDLTRIFFINIDSLHRRLYSSCTEGCGRFLFAELLLVNAICLPEYQDILHYGLMLYLSFFNLHNSFHAKSLRDNVT